MEKQRTNSTLVAPLELWSGVECTINRVGENYLSQCEKNGHFARLTDFDLFADLGIKRIRHPIIWEMVQGDRAPGDYDFSWTDQSLNRMQELGISAIAGLVHHGSGPRFTSLLDPEFPEKLARYARAVSERYPFLDHYTPVNEPLTTARFSALYGIWFPHATSTNAFLTALINQCRGVALAMKEIRKVQPSAKLVQTEDMGRAQATLECADQLDFENHRRWLSFDLLCGVVTPKHRLYKWLVQNGVTKQSLLWFAENPCPPDLIGVNHYPLSNRFLDHRTDKYPRCFHGGNSRMRYADVGVQQARDLHGVADGELAPQFIPAKEIVRETWERYRIPVAITEAHINGHREAQLRWLQEVWQGAGELRAEGADIRAVTAWSLLGSYDWNSLCSMSRGFYESGVFDIRTSEPRATAIANMATSLAKTGDFEHPVLHRRTATPTRPILVTGGEGRLANAFVRAAAARGLELIALPKEKMDITHRDQVRAAIATAKPWAVINAAAYSSVDGAEVQTDLAFAVNAEGSEILAQECAQAGVPLLAFSSHMVFNGTRAEPTTSPAYRESDEIAPLNAYGRSKAEMEKRLVDFRDHSLIVRTSALFGPWDEKNFVSRVIQNLSAGTPIFAPSDIVISPTYVPELVQTCLDLLIDGTTGVIHLANDGQISWFEFARRTAEIFSLDRRLIRAKAAADMGFIAQRPRFSAMASDRVRLMMPLEDVLQRHLLLAQ